MTNPAVLLIQPAVWAVGLALILLAYRGDSIPWLGPGDPSGSRADLPPLVASERGLSQPKNRMLLHEVGTLFLLCISVATAMWLSHSSVHMYLPPAGASIVLLSLIAGYTFWRVKAETQSSRMSVGHVVSRRVLYALFVVILISQWYVLSRLLWQWSMGSLIADLSLIRTESTAVLCSHSSIGPHFYRVAISLAVVLLPVYVYAPTLISGTLSPRNAGRVLMLVACLFVVISITCTYFIYSHAVAESVEAIDVGVQHRILALKSAGSSENAADLVDQVGRLIEVRGRLSDSLAFPTWSSLLVLLQCLAIGAGAFGLKVRKNV